MIKLVVTIYRKSGMTLEAFGDRWLNGHGPLVRKHAATLRIRKYVQSHYAPAPDFEAALAMRGWSTRPDAMTEVWYDSIEDIHAGMASPEGMIANVELEADERVFCDMERMQAFLTHEEVIIDPVGLTVSGGHA